MLNTLIYAASDLGQINLYQTVANGTYHIYVWTMENLSSNQRRWNLNAEGQRVAQDLGNLALNQWRRYGPYTTSVNDGSLTLNLVGVVGRPTIMGLEIYSYK
ncbi:MAG: hypothetical protein ABI690_36510 [Chloroflexota bacterium]